MTTRLPLGRTWVTSMATWTLTWSVRVILPVQQLSIDDAKNARTSGVGEEDRYCIALFLARGDAARGRGQRVRRGRRARRARPRQDRQRDGARTRHGGVEHLARTRVADMDGLALGAVLERLALRGKQQRRVPQDDCDELALANDNRRLQIGRPHRLARPG